jgi:predicted deacylase
MVAGVHGDEFEGVRALGELGQEVDASELRGTLIIVPVVNMPAYQAGQRVSPLDGLNLARTTPGRPDGSPTERLGYALFHYIVEGSDLVVDMHSAGTKLVMLPVAGFCDLPTDAGHASWAAACAMGLDWVWETPQWPGILTYEAVKRGIPACGAEIGGMGRCLDEDVALYKRTLYNLLGYMGMLPIEIGPLNRVQALAGEWLLSPASGFFTPRVALGQTVRQGDILATIRDVYGALSAEIAAAEPGIVVSVRTFASINVGEWTVCVCQKREAPGSA